MFYEPIFTRDVCPSWFTPSIDMSNKPVDNGVWGNQAASRKTFFYRLTKKKGSSLGNEVANATGILPWWRHCEYITWTVWSYEYSASEDGEGPLEFWLFDFLTTNVLMGDLHECGRFLRQRYNKATNMLHQQTNLIKETKWED